MKHLTFLFNTLVFVTVFTTVACSHQRRVQIDGELSADATSNNSDDNSDVSVATDNNATNVDRNTSSEDVAGTVTPKTDETNSDESKKNPDLHSALSPADGAGNGDSSGGGDNQKDPIDLMASLDETTKDAMNGDASSAQVLAATTPLLVAQNEAPVAPAPNEEPTLSSSVLETAILETERRALPVSVPSAKRETNVHSRTKANLSQGAHAIPEKKVEATESTHSTPTTAAPVKAPPVAKRALPREEATTPPVQASAGIASFIEQHVLWVSIGLVGFIVCLFFFIKRRKEDDTLSV